MKLLIIGWLQSISSIQTLEFAVILGQQVQDQTTHINDKCHGMRNVENDEFASWDVLKGRSFEYNHKFMIIRFRSHHLIL